MAIYEVNGSRYELPDTMQGQELVDTLQKLKGLSPAPSQPKPDPRMQKISSYLEETDRVLGLPAGTSYAQIDQESKFDSNAKSRRGALGLAQVMPKTRATLEQRMGRKLNPHNDDDALVMHRELMKENMGQFKNVDDALRAYNGGWDRTKWGNKETTEYVQKIRKGTGAPAPKEAYKPFAKVRENIDPASLKSDKDWLLASQRMYLMREQKPFEGSAEELAEWGKEFMGYFNYNMVDMARYAHDVNTNGTQEDKQAFLFMMDTYDNTNVSREGVGRALKGIATDPTTYVGIGTLGIGTAAKVAGSAAAKQTVKQLLMKSLGRTGIIAGVEGGIYGGTANAIQQSVEVNAGRRDSYSAGGIAGGVAVGATAGVVLGTTADAALSAISGVVRRKFGKPSAAVPPAADPGGNPGVAPPGAAPASPIPTQGATPNAPAAAVVPGQAQAAATPPGRQTILTDAEIGEATGRKQKGRLPEDDVMPVDPTQGTSITVTPRNSGLRTTIQNMDELTQMGGEVADQLRVLDDKSLGQTLEALRWEARPIEETRVVARGIQILADELRVTQAEIVKKINLEPNHADVPVLQQQLREIEDRLAPVSLADDAFGSMGGSMLRQRSEGLPGLQGITIESIQAQGNLTRAQAEVEFVRLVEASKQTVDAQKVTQTYDRAIQAAVDAGNIGEAGRLAAVRQMEMEAGLPPAKTSWMAKLNELAISNVFTPTTVMVNLVPSGLKTLFLPVIRAIVSDPLEKATRVEMVASYSAMKSSVGSALRAARAAYKYERAMLTRDVSNLLEGDMAIEGKKGGWIRVFPRILNATDEFLGHLNYNGFVAGRAGAEAAADGAQRGLKGKALDDFVQTQIKTALDGAFKSPSGIDLVQPIINKGMKLGYTGEKLAEFVRREAAKDPMALRHGSDEAGMDFARDVLYKRRFSGDGIASGAAVGYEQLMNRIPAMRFALGQLFFRTPIRVFEEGVRLTPGLQIIAPNFLKDLAGRNGMQRQVRAQGEALASLAVAGMALTLYSEGKLQGAGAYDNYRQGRLRSDSGLPDAYTLKMDDGSTWSFRGFDPVAIPLKMMVNGFEQMDKLRIREAQGEFIGADIYRKALASVTVGTLAIAAAFKDANLVSGLNTSVDFFKDLGDPEGRETATLKLLGERLKVLVPNTMHKIAKDNDPRITDPATFWQVVDSRLADNRLGGEDIKTSFAYDVLGNVRTPADTGTLWNIFSVATPEERARGKSPEALEVLAEMDRLAQVTGAIFAPPLKHEMTGELDLRTVLTSDKKETLFDRWQRKYAELNPDKVLHPVAMAPLPDGTFKVQGMKAEALQSTVKELRDAAFMQMMAEEHQVVDQVVKTARNQLESKAGLNDYGR